MFNKKRLFIFIIFILFLFFMMTFASQPGGVRRVNTREVKFVDGYTKQVISTQTVEVGKDATVPEAPQHDNCRFSGWYTENDVRIDDFTNIINNLTVYSGCEVNYYTVRFYDTISRRVVDTQRVRGGEDADAPTAPRHEGYTFVRWNGKYTDVNADVRVDTVYRANSAAYKVEYYTVKDEVSTLYTTRNLTGIANTNAQAEIITIEGYTYDSANTSNVLSGVIASNGSLVLRVYYNVNSYNVIIDPNCEGDKCDENTEEHKYGDEITLKELERKFVLSYKEADEISEDEANKNQDAIAKFIGYCKNATTCETVIEAGTKVEVKADVTYYAQWDNSGLTLEVADGHNYQTTTTDYTFLNWLDGSNEVNAKDSITLSSDKELVAKYNDGTPRKYNLTINYVYEDGSEAATTYNEEVANGTTYNVASPEANKKGYHPETETVTGTMPTEDVSVEVKYVANTDTAYKVEHYTENLDGSYKLEKTENLTGTTDTEVTASAQTFEGFTFDETVEGTVKSGNVAGDGSLTLKLYYTRNSYKVTYKYTGTTPSGASELPAETEYKYGESVTVAEAATAPGYTFSGWSKENFTMPAEAVEITGSFTANQNTAYKVEHYTENLDGSYKLEKTENLTGTTDTEVTASAQTFEGFTFDETVEGTVKSGNVAGDGSLTLKLYYTRNSYKVTYKYTGTTPSGASELPAETEYKYGESVTVAEAATAPGYTFSGWSKENFTMPAEAVEITGSFTTNTDTAYKVEHYKQNLDGTYPTEASETENKTDGTTDTEVTATAKSYEGFTFDETVEGTVKSGNVAGDGSLTLKLYYTRDSHNVTVTYKYANNEHPAVPVGPDSYKYEAEYSYTTPEVAGYTADKATVSGTMGTTDVTEEVTYTAKNTMPYTIEHYKQNLDGTYPTEASETENKTDGTTDTTVTATPKTYEGFTFDETVEGTVKSGTITANENLVLKLYYKRETYIITIDPHCEDTDNDSCETITEPHPYGDQITLENLERKYTLTFEENTNVNPKIGSIDAEAEFLGYCKDATNCDPKVQPGTITVEGPATYHAVWNEEGLHVAIVAGGNYSTETESGDFLEWKDSNNTTVELTNDKFVTKSETLTAQYTKKYVLTITYVYSDGSEAADTYTQTLEKDSTYNVTSPTITGYNADKATVSGTITANVNETVTYSKKVVGYTVNFYYDGELNNSISDQTKEYGDVVSYTDYETPANMKVDMDATNPTSITIGEDASENVLNIYYKTTTAELSVNTVVDAPRDPAEYDDEITITVTIKNIGDGTGKATVKDSELAKALYPETGNALISIESSNVKVDGTESSDYNALDILSNNGLVIDNMEPDQTVVVTLVVKVKANAGDKINSKVESKVNDSAFTTESTNQIEVEKTLSFNKITEQLVGTNVVIALDASGSMLDKDNGKTLLKYAQEATESFIKNVFPNSDIDATHTNVVVLKYGSKEVVTGQSCMPPFGWPCWDDHENQPFAEQVGTTLTSYANRQSLINSVNNIEIVEPSGTPYYIALEKVNEVLYGTGGLASTHPDNKNVVVFLTDGAPDGLDNADRRAAAISALHADDKETIVYAVALGNGASGAQAILEAIAGDSSRVITTGASGLEAEFKKISIEAAPDPSPKQTEEGVAEIGTDLRVDDTHKLTIIVNKGTSSERTLEYSSIADAKAAGYLTVDTDGKYDIDATLFEAADTIYVSFYGNTGRSVPNRAATKKFSALYGPLYDGLVDGEEVHKVEIPEMPETEKESEVKNTEEVVEENTIPTENVEVIEPITESNEENTESEEVVNNTTPSETENLSDETNNDKLEANETITELPKEVEPVGELVSVETITEETKEDEEKEEEVKVEEPIPAIKEEVSTEVVNETLE